MDATEEGVTKYISLNKVPVNVAGTQDKLFVVRDLSPMVDLQRKMHLNQNLSDFSAKLLSTI